MSVNILTVLVSLFCLDGLWAGITIKRQGRDIFIHLPRPQVSLERSKLSKIRVSGLMNSTLALAPALPQMSFILEGKPKTLKVEVSVLDQEVIEGVTPSPGQLTQSRGESFQISEEISEELYTAKGAEDSHNSELHYIGEFRGTHLTRVKINVGKYSRETNTVSIAQELKVTHNSKEFQLKTKKFNKYLIIVPEELKEGLETFIAWKESLGFIVAVEVLNSNLISKETIQNIVKDYYKRWSVHFVMLVGTDKLLPTDYVRTGFSWRTPSDLYYFTQGGKGDYIPDVFSSRIAVETPDQLRRILWKSIRYEMGLYSDFSGYQSVVGVASNEGARPSDNEYIQGIGKLFKKNYGMLYTHFYENNVSSNRVKFNQAMNRGASWLTYMGHGSGGSWPSFYQTYGMSDIVRLKNQEVVKPVIIDVACQNGRFSGTNFLGAQMMAAVDKEGLPLGATAYYGGSVNISWHPPAIMAKGIAVERFEKGFQFLGEALLLGQLYLAKNWDSSRDVVDNMEWYHLQGDPGLRVRYDQK